MLVNAWFFCLNRCTEGKKVTQNLWQLNLSMKRDSDIGDLRLAGVIMHQFPSIIQWWILVFFNFFLFMENFRPVVPLQCQQRRRSTNKYCDCNFWLQTILCNYRYPKLLSSRFSHAVQYYMYLVIRAKKFKIFCFAASYAVYYFIADILGVIRKETDS